MKEKLKIDVVKQLVEAKDINLTSFDIHGRNEKFSLKCKILAAGFHNI